VVVGLSGDFISGHFADLNMVDFKAKTDDLKKLFSKGFKSVKNAFKSGWEKVKHIGKKKEVAQPS